MSGDPKFASPQVAVEYYGGQQLDDHATRLRALESGHSDLNAQLAANTVQLEGLNEGVARLIDQVGSLHRVITTSIPPLANDIAALKSVESARVAKRDKRRGFVSRYVSGALVAISAGMATKFLPSVWAHLHW